MKGAVGVGCAGAVGLAAGGGMAVSTVLVCCLSFCLESSCGTLRGPISLAGTGTLCCCHADEAPHAISQREKNRGAHDQKVKWWQMSSSNNNLNSFENNAVLDLQVSPQSCWHCCPSLHSDLLVLLYNRYGCQPGCGMSVWSCDASFGSQMVALYHPKDVEDVCTPLRYSCPGHGRLFSPP